MPEAGYKYPGGMFSTPTEARAFCQTVRGVVAREMGGVNPEGDRVVFDAMRDVDVPGMPYNVDASSTTAVVMMTIITYRWESRMGDMETRLLRIGEALAPLVPRHLVTDWKKAINITFLSKEPGCWVEV